MINRDFQPFQGSLVLFERRYSRLVRQASLARPRDLFGVVSTRTVCRAGVSVNLSPQQWLVFIAVFGPRDSAVSTDDIADAICLGRADGGPEFIGKVISKQIHDVRVLIRPLGLAIVIPRHRLLCAAEARLSMRIAA